LEHPVVIIIEAYLGKYSISYLVIMISMLLIHTKKQNKIEY